MRDQNDKNQGIIFLAKDPNKFLFTSQYMVFKMILQDFITVLQEQEQSSCFFTFMYLRSANYMQEIKQILKTKFSEISNEDG